MSGAEAAAGSFWRRLGPRVVLLLGLGAGAAVLLPAVPEEQVVVFRVARADLRRLSVSYTREGETEPRSGATLRFATPPRASPSHRVLLPRGRYVVAIDLEHAAGDAGTKETSYVRRVNLEGGETVLPLDESP